MNGKTAVFDLEDRLVHFAAQVIEITEMLPASRAGNHIAGQLIRSGTAPAANYAEAQGAESRRDFIHKLKVVFKELRETRVWFRIIHHRDLATEQESIEAGMAECEELIRIIGASLTTAQRNSRGGKKDTN